MLKRLSFALVAISFSVPVVACLNAASEETASGEANVLSAAEKAACNFGFAETAADPADPSIAPADKKGVADASRAFVWGDANGDQKVDLLVASGKGEVSLYPGKGDGHFGAAVTTALGALPTGNWSESSIAPIGMGDFDGDGKKDFVVIQTLVGATPVIHTEGRYVFGFGKDDGSFDVVAEKPSLVEGEARKSAKWHSIADLNGDGIDDLVAGGIERESIRFGAATRTFLKGKTGLKPSTSQIVPIEERVLTFASAKTGLVANTRYKSWKVTFKDDGTPNPFVETKFVTPEASMNLATDLDGNDAPELAIFVPGSDQLLIQPLSGTDLAAKKFVKFEGTRVDNVDFGLSLAGDTKRQLVFKTDARKLYAACGYTPDAKEIVAAELPVAYGEKTFVAGTPDLNGDGKPDFATFDSEAKALKVFLGAPPPATLPAQVSFFVDGYTPPKADAGPGPVEAGGPIIVVPTDAGPTDSGVKDAGPPKPDAGTDAGTKKDAGTITVDAGPSKNDAGTAGDDDDDDDDTTAGDDDDDDVTVVDAGKKGGKKDDKTDNGATTSSSGSTSGSFTVTVTEKPKPEDDGGCRTAPGSSSGSGSVALGGVVALFVLGGRRRRKSA